MADVRSCEIVIKTLEVIRDGYFNHLVLLVDPLEVFDAYLVNSKEPTRRFNFTFLEG